MSKELEALNKIQHDFGQLKGQELVSCYETIFNALKRLEAIDNSNPSEALECLEKIIDNLDDYADFEIKQEANEYIDTIKQALLKAQFLEEEYNNLMEDKDNLESELFKLTTPKQYLKWEDLEFGVPTSLPTTMKVKMGDTQYCLCLRTSFSDVKSVVLRDTNLKPILHLFEKEKQIFNDLHLERVL